MTLSHLVARALVRAASTLMSTPLCPNPGLRKPLPVPCRISGKPRSTGSSPANPARLSVPGTAPPRHPALAANCTPRPACPIRNYLHMRSRPDRAAGICVPGRRCPTCTRAEPANLRPASACPSAAAQVLLPNRPSPLRTWSRDVCEQASSQLSKWLYYAGVAVCSLLSGGFSG
jgi:hypothetical protein